MRELAFGGRKSQQTVVAEKVACRALAGIGRAGTGAVVDVDAPGDGLAVRIDPAGTDSAIVCRSRSIRRKQVAIRFTTRPWSACATGGIDKQFTMRSDRKRDPDCAR